MLLVLVRSFLFLATLRLSIINRILVNRITGTIGSVASSIVGNKEAQGKNFRFVL